MRRLLRRPPHRGRLEMYAQLRSRRSFPNDAWSSLGVPPALVTHILRLLERGMKWPNCNFVPADRLELCLISEYDEYPWAWFFATINKNYGTRYGTEDFLRLKHNKVTLGGLVTELSKVIGTDLTRRTGPTGPVQLPDGLNGTGRT